MDFLSILGRGAENAVPASELCAALGVTPRGLRHLVAAGRVAGVEILYQPGGHGGYFLPSENPEQAQQERLAFYGAMKARALCTLKSLRPVALALGVPVGQLDFDSAELKENDDEP